MHTNLPTQTWQRIEMLSKVHSMFFPMYVVKVRK